MKKMNAEESVNRAASYRILGKDTKISEDSRSTGLTGVMRSFA